MMNVYRCNDNATGSDRYRNVLSCLFPLIAFDGESLQRWVSRLGLSEPLLVDS